MLSPIRKTSRRSANDRLRVVLLGYIVRGPMGGMSWQNLNFIAALAALGHEAAFIEIGDKYESCYDPRRYRMSNDPSYGIAYASDVFKKLGLTDRWAYYDASANTWRGPIAERAPGFCASADVVINMSGVNPIDPWFAEVPHRVLIDTDPAFTQIRYLTNPAAREAANRHTAFFSIGENIPAGTSSVPDDGFPWQATRLAIALDRWPVAPGRSEGEFTTVMLWESYPSREYAGRHYGMKSQSFAEFADLPARVGSIFRIAMGGVSLPHAALGVKGWRFCNPLKIAPDPWTYQDFIANSKAEFTVAKHGYVATRCGWFSERSAGYLAAGRPVVTHDTGFSDWLRGGGRGVLGFTTIEEAAAAIESVNSDYAAHCRAARDIAEAYFDAGVIIGSLIERTLAGAAVAPPPTQRARK